MPAEFTISTPDAELVLAARRGDKRAFVEIVARHQAMVCGIALGILGDFAASEDAGQEAFLTAWRKVHELREPERLRGWLAQIARNAALGQLRRKRGHEVLEEELAVPDAAPTPDEAVATEEETALVSACLAKLPETYRLPLVLYYRQGQSVRSVAEALGLSEDATKQRLSRGREMLRERMAGVVETILTRTKPTAIFTMAVAVAIGALVAPAAMAGTAFAGASTAGASTAAASVSNVLTAMSTSKAFLATAALAALVCVPVGYHLSSGRARSPGSQRVRAIAEKVAPLTDPATTFEDSALIAQWRELHQRYGTNAEAMPLLHKAIAALRDPFRQRAFNAALTAEWAQVDPVGGLKFFLNKGANRSQRDQFFQEWFTRAPGKAVEGLLARDPGWEGLAREYLPDIARQLPARVPDIVPLLSKPEEFWDASVRNAYAILAQGDLESARKLAEALNGPNRDQALAGVAQEWAKNDLSKTIAWAKGLPDGIDRDEIIRAALVGQAAVDPAAALDLVGTVPSGGRYAYFASTTGARVLDAAAKANFDATVAWVVAHPGRLGGEDLYGLVGAVTERLNADPAGFLSAHTADGSLSALIPAVNNALLNEALGQCGPVWEWLKTQPENQTTKALREQVLSSEAYEEPEQALRLLPELAHTAEGDSEVRSLAEHLFNGGNALQRFDQIFPEAPERLRQPLLEAAFHYLSPDGLDDPQRWISRLSLLSDAARPQGTEKLASTWATQNPEEASGWASTLPSGESRSDAFGAIASKWAAKDPQGAVDWVVSLPPGTDRDRSAQSLVMALAQQYPREAWDWALSIGDSSRRSSAAMQAAGAMMTRDPSTARQWIETGPFDSATRAKLEGALERGGPTPVAH